MSILSITIFVTEKNSDYVQLTSPGDAEVELDRKDRVAAGILVKDSEKSNVYQLHKGIRARTSRN